MNGNELTVTDLLLSGTGDFNLDTLTNSISNLAADINGNLVVQSDIDMVIGDLTFLSVCGNVSITGVNVDQNGGAGGNLTITLDNSDLSQVAPVTVEGNTVLNVGAADICWTGPATILSERLTRLVIR